MFEVGDTVIRTVDGSMARRLDAGSIHTVEHVIKLRENSRLRYIELVGVAGLWNAENFELLRPETMEVSSLDYMNDTVLDERDKRIIGEALCSQ